MIDAMSTPSGYLSLHFLNSSIQISKRPVADQLDVFPADDFLADRSA